MKSALALLLISAIALANAWAAKISGFVRDDQGSAAPGAHIILAGNQAPVKPLSTTSNAQGAYQFLAVPPGAYHIQASLSGFAEQSAEVNVSASSVDVTLDLTLSRSSATRPEFEAAGVRGLIDPGGYSASSNAAAATDLIKGIADINRTGNDEPPAGRNLQPCSVGPALERAVEENPGSVAANLALGEFYLDHDRTGKAIPLLERARSLDQSNQRAVNALAEAYLKAGRFDAARKLLNAPAGTQADPAALVQLARAHEGSGDFAAAARDYEAAASHEPSEENIFGSGYELILAGLPKDAEQAFQGGIQRYPNSSKLLVGLGSAQFLEGHSSASVQTLLHAAELNPADPRPYPFLSEASGTSPVEAEQTHPAFERFLSAAPNNPRAAYYAALNLLQQQPQSANDTRIEALLKHAIVLNPGLADAHFELGVLYANHHQDERASQELETAVRLSPSLKEAHYRLALAYRQTGHKDLSAREMQRFEALQAASASQAAAGHDSIEQFISVFTTTPAAKDVSGCPP